MRWFKKSNIVRNGRILPYYIGATSGKTEPRLFFVTKYVQMIRIVYRKKGANRMEIKGIITSITKKVCGAKVIFRVQLDADSAKEQNTGSMECLYFNSRLNLYMPVVLTGDIKNGVFEATRLKPYFSRSDQVARYMTNKIKGCGIGKKRVEAIVSQFGADVFTMPRPVFKERLESEFKGGISAKSIAAFLDEWYYVSTISDLEEFFAPYEVSYSSIEKIDEEYGTGAIAKFKKDPYTECIKFDIKRQVADNIAHDLHIDELDKRRIAGLISYALLQIGNEGHTYIQAKDLGQRVNRLSIKSIYRCNIPIVCVANEVTTNRIFHLDNNNGYVSFKSIHDEEMNIAIRLKRIDEGLKSGIVIEDAEIEAIEDMLHTRYGTGQRNAFHMLEQNGIMVLTGGPGTGKTTVINGIIIYYQKKNPGQPVLLCAPTGRAAKRLSESTGMEAKTIQKLLEFNPFQDNGAERNNNNPLEAGLIILDEGSMCDTHLFSMLLNAIPENCRFLIVGDEDQLPSVGPGNCLHDVISSGLFPVYRLTENFRSEGTIIDNGKRVLKGKEPIKADDFAIGRAKNEFHAYSILSRLMDMYYKKDEPFYCQLIEASKKGAAGCDALNIRTHRNTHKELGEDISDELMNGDKIMFIRNEYVNEMDENGETRSVPIYTNGEVAVIEDLDDDEVTLFDGTDERTMKRSVLNDARYAYSYTIHKSQGSENGVIIIYLSGEENVKRMMNRNLLYTAITRAKKKVILLYTGDALESCLKNEYFVKRRTRVLEFLQETSESSQKKKAM